MSTKVKSESFLATLLALLLTITAVLGSSGCATQRMVAQHESAIAQMPAPVLVHRPIMDDLEKFGRLLRVNLTATGERDVIFGIDPILNKTGIDKEVPSDVSQWIRQVIAKIGYPLRTYESVPTPSLVRSVFSGPGAQNERPPHQLVSYRVVGSLQRVFQRSVRGNELEAYGRASNGQTSVDAQAKRTNRITITRLTLSLTLEQPDGLDVRGATAAYSIEILKDEFDRSMGVYVGGTGIGGGANFVLAQDLGDAIFDAAGATLMNIIGAAVSVPYYRCSRLFPVDEALNAREFESLNRLSRREIEEQQLKPYLYLSGIPLDMSGPGLTDSDKGKIAAQMRSRSLDFANRAQLVTFAFQLWRDIDIDRTAERLETRMEEIIRHIKEVRAEKDAEAVRQTAREAAWEIKPSQFGWTDSVRMVLLDLSAVQDASLRDRIIAAVQACDGCEEVKTDQTKTVVAARLRASSPEWHVQQALRLAHLNADYRWIGDRQQRLSVITR